jgi:hypothetical protein
MPELDLDTLQQAARAERLERAQHERREVLPLEYLPKDARQRPPFDWPATLRQFFFSVGVGFITGGFFSWLGGYSIWRYNEVVWIALGAFFMTLMIPWPGRFGFKRL